MYIFDVNYDQRFYVVKLIDELTEIETEDLIHEMINFSDSINYRRFGSITDMRELKLINQEASRLIEIGMKISLKLGYVGAARIYKEIKNETVKTMNDLNVGAGFVANYFTDINKAIEFITRAIEKYPDKPVITKERAEEYLWKEFPFLMQ